MATSSRYVVSSTVLFLVIGFLALLGIVAAALWLGERTQVHFNQVVAAREQRTATVDLRNALYAAESAQRGYLVSGNEIYLAPFEVARSQALRLLSDLRQAHRGVPDAAAAVQRLTEITAEKYAEMDQTIALKRGRHDDEALALFQTNRGKAMMDEANVFFTGLMEAADKRLAAGVEEQTQIASLHRLASGAGVVVIILVVLGASMVLVRYTRELRSARDEVGALNAELERRVADRTQDLVAARDRATALLSEVNHRIANSLTLVSSLVGLQSKAVSDVTAKGALAEAQDRIFAVSLVHKRLYSAGTVGVVQLDDYLSGLLDHLRSSLRGTGHDVTLSYAIEPLTLATDMSINLGVVVTEWVTNAYKYAYPDEAGEVRVSVKAQEGGMVRLRVEDDGVGRVDGAPAQGTGLGTRIVSAMAANMHAEITYEQRAPGTAAILIFPQKS